MINPINYDSARQQMEATGLLFDALVPDGRVRRCKTTEDRERRGWYCLHEWTAGNGKTYLVGTYGIWHGNDNGARKIEIAKDEAISADELAALRKRVAEDKKRAKANRDREAKAAAGKAAAVWRKALTEPPAGVAVDYLTRKQVQSYGLRYTDSGALVVPMMDPHRNVHGLQFILPSHHPRRKKTGRDKEYWPAGLAKQGHYYLIGSPTSTGICLVAEGYATAATLHAATGLPVAVAFDAGNLLPVCRAIKSAYGKARLLVCADDDYLTDGNPGCTAAAAAAMEVGGTWTKPQFPADREGKKLTDYNDLQAFPSGGLHLVREQIESALRQAKWDTVAQARGLSQQGGGENGANGDNSLKPLLGVDEACVRFSLIYGAGGTLFDHEEHALIPKSDVLDICVDHAWRDWKRMPDRRVVRLTEVGFDPAGTDPAIKCNLWGGWPTTPKRGRCDKLLDLLRYLCGLEQNDAEVYDWVLRWIAYPIQHPGAKMKTALVFHGPQGAGKNLFFEAVMGIYGPYGRIVDQAAIEDKFNDWASRKLFLIGDEVVARQELFHQKNKLKALITGDTIRINPKNVAAHEEKNHVNIVFLSNEKQPLVLEPWDRRYTVVWTPDKLPETFYHEVAAEIADGGLAALHHHLLNLDLAGFHPHTKPIITRAKQDLIDVSLDSTERFLRDWQGGETAWPFGPCGSMDLFKAYLRWSRDNGVQRPRESNQFLAHIAKLPGWSNKPRHRFESTHYTGETKPTRMVIPAATDLDIAGRAQPPNKTQSQWLTDCFFDFRNVLDIPQ